MPKTLDFETGLDQTGEPKLQTNIEAIFQKLFRKYYCLSILSDTVFEDYYPNISRWGAYLQRPKWHIVQAQIKILNNNNNNNMLSHMTDFFFLNEHATDLT